MVVLISGVLAIAGVAAALALYYVYRRQPITLRGAVVARNSDVDKQVPIAAVKITAGDGLADGNTWSGSTGFFELTLHKWVRVGEPVPLDFRHPGYEPLHLNVLAGDKLYVAQMLPIAQPRREATDAPRVVISDIAVRYSVKTTTAVNVGSVAKAFRVVNTGNVPCRGLPPCSPGGKWKASTVSQTLEAGDGNVFRSARVSCIAGPCPFTRIKSDGFSRGGPTLKISILDWSGTTTFLFEAEVFRPLASDSVRISYPVIFGRALNFTVPAASEGVSIEADVNGEPIVFPLGPELRLAWASCTAHINPDHTKVYRCALKPGYRFK